MESKNYIGHTGQGMFNPGENKKLVRSVTVTVILGFVSVASIVFMFLALSDIADGGETTLLEWHITGVCLILQALFIVSTFTTVALMMKRIFPKEASKQ